MDSIENIRRKCIDFLLKIRELTDNDETAYVNIDSVAGELALDQAITEHVIKHLLIDKFIERGLGQGIRITQMGIMKVKGKTLDGGV